MSENPVWLLATSLYAMLATWCICTWAPLIGKRFKLLDFPSGRKIHSEPTPLVGGFSLLLVLGPIMPIIMIVFDPQGIGNLALSVIALATAACAIIGISDDRHSLNATLRIVTVVAIFILCAVVDKRFMITSLHISWLSAPVVLPIWAEWILTPLILVGFVNAVNMADGKNGIVIVTSICWAFALTLYGPNGLVIIMLPLVLMLGIIATFNLRGKVFLGDGGSYGLACFFGLTSIYVYNLAPGRIFADWLALLFFIPGIDMLRLFCVRILAGRSPMVGDRNHLHHHLYNLLGWPNGLYIYISLLIVPAMAAVIDRPKTLVFMSASLIAYTTIIVIGSRRQRVSKA
jgi:UDP-GlcNAc:undecaprenyl-phosphate/decaprenyl-phosphate GlcNAc-1-phosphate transferase